MTLFNTLRSVKNLLNYNLIKSLFILYITLLLLSVIELLSLATVPALISFLLSGNYNFFNSNNFLLNEGDGNNSALFIIIVIIIIFTLKSLFLVFANYYEINVLRKAKVFITNELMKKYLNNDYIFFVENNSSLLSRNLITETNNCISYIQSIITISKEVLLLLSPATVYVRRAGLFSFLHFSNIVKMLFFIFCNYLV